MISRPYPLILALTCALAALSHTPCRGASSRLHPAAAMPVPASRDRILILAPHCDDDAVACGGLIAEAVAARAAVHIAYITNGDGFRVVAEKVFSETSVPPQDYLKLAALRQREALAAASELGVPRRQVTFLGYPDRGSEPMWLYHWDPGHPFTGPYTRADHNPYQTSLRPGAPYAGRSLLDDLETVIRRFRPTIVITGHPADHHPDHSTLYCYTVAALHELDLLHRVRLYAYLVHRADKWRSPSGRLLDPTSPPDREDECNTQWLTLPLDSRAQRLKRAAINDLRTQMLVMKDSLLNFARDRELFGRLPAPDLLLLNPAGGAPTDRDWKQSLWGLLSPALRDPRGDVAGLDPPPAADIVALSLARGPRGLLLRLDLAGPPSPQLEYRVHLSLLLKGAVGPPRTYAIKVNHPSPGLDLRVAGTALELNLPLPEHPPLAGVIIAAETCRGPSQLDRTAWVLLGAPAWPPLWPRARSPRAGSSAGPAGGAPGLTEPGTRRSRR